MNVRYHIDADTNLPHIYGHGVTESEVEEVLRGTGENIPGNRKNSRIKLGQTAAGRYLQVVFVPDDDRRGVFVVTAYELDGKAKRAFRRRHRRRGR